MVVLNTSYFSVCKHYNAHTQQSYNLFLFVKIYLFGQFIELDIFKDLCQSLPGDRLQSHSIEPLLYYLDIDLFSILLVHAVYNSIYHFSMLVIQQKSTKFPIFVCDSRCNINTLMA